MTKQLIAVCGITFVFALAFAPTNAFADKKKKSHEAAETASAPVIAESTSSTVDHALGLGLTTYAGNAFSAWYQLDAANSIQGVFSIENTSPFTFSVGGLYRHTLKGDRHNGFHVGGGAILGTTAGTTTITATGVSSSTNFVVNITPNLGVHFTLPHLDSMLFSIDGGPQFIINGGTFTFQANGYSGLLGLSAHYLF